MNLGRSGKYLQDKTHNRIVSSVLGIDSIAQLLVRLAVTFLVIFHGSASELGVVGLLRRGNSTRRVMRLLRRRDCTSRMVTLVWVLLVLFCVPGNGVVRFLRWRGNCARRVVGLLGWRGDCARKVIALVWFLPSLFSVAGNGVVRLLWRRGDSTRRVMGLLRWGHRTRKVITLVRVYDTVYCGIADDDIRQDRRGGNAEEDECDERFGKAHGGIEVE